MLLHDSAGLRPPAGTVVDPCNKRAVVAPIADTVAAGVVVSRGWVERGGYVVIEKGDEDDVVLAGLMHAHLHAPLGCNCRTGVLPCRHRHSPDPRHCGRVVGRGSGDATDVDAS